MPLPTPVPKTERSPAPTPTLLPPTQPRPPPSAFAPAPAQPTAVVKPKSRHSRHMTEFTPSPVDDAFEGRMPGLAHRKSSTLTRAQARRARMSASVYEPGPDAAGRAKEFESEADAFRARIEALRSDMGEGWLKVFNQSQIVGSPPRASS
uniref:Adenylate cyclase AcyA n=1 Tax=Ganoderma boninense TaxID=34458 RepID=A0A5K1JZ78_9APHY|nr:Adenylate cyclase AcyA [Ganoderma boninense]